MKPFVSFIIPTYNVAGYVEKTIESLLKQTSKNFEVVLIDDNSTDDTVHVVEQILTNQNEIQWTLLRNSANSGPGASRNLGIEQARGDYLIFLDGDDRVESTLVERLESAKRDFKVEKDIDVFVWKYVELSADGTQNIPRSPFTGVVPNVVTSGTKILQAMLIERCFHIWTTSFAVNRKLVSEKRLRFPEECRKGEDLTFILQVLANARYVLFLDSVLSYYLQRKTSISRTFSAKDLQVYNCLIQACGALLNATDDNKLFGACEEFAFYRFLNYFEALTVKWKDAWNWSTFVSKLDSEFGIGGEVEKLINSVHHRISRRKKLISKRCLSERVKFALFKLSPRFYWFLYRLKSL
ncbi:glycosyltransferase family 2 protein [Fervidobacterium thailandense]|uniref:Glycosyltransferase 2-like domain-containing protein n=1 Tax=Fervidobacterium thailandense TaxID=1008305 RepID=A0A1E3G2Y6_9BACT|nr:glycosyltransferase family 2 protein [Fervidobacterium thailandense]ODN30532.1 hypothetical protein A4H02_04580 [Fervidobacterium thailandense]